MRRFVCLLVAVMTVCICCLSGCGPKKGIPKNAPTPTPPTPTGTEQK